LQIFSKFGVVLKIITFTKNGEKIAFFCVSFAFHVRLDKFQGLIQLKDANIAQAAKLVRTHPTPEPDRSILF
jgi:hypothetical protein